ncbi:hypothetical protein KC730_00365 [Candidatus Kaiserbacteria bacterium]|nr:hypothetical protein [Candidatus Kaiserbacteria bacterium]
MTPEYYALLASEFGYGNAEKEKTWNECPEDERLHILQKLMSSKNVFRCLDIEGSINLTKMSRCDFNDLPMTIGVFVFFTFNGTDFSLANLEKDFYRFLV